jgi:hypothetical protein
MTVAGRGPATATPWGVSLKPVPRKVVTEEVSGEGAKTDSKPLKSKPIDLKSVKSVLYKKENKKTEHVELQVSVRTFCLLGIHSYSHLFSQNVSRKSSGHQVCVEVASSV